MASVWQAYHLSLDIDVAIKFLEPRWSGSDEVASRFAQEATAIARIQSPHVVRVLDYGFTGQGHAFIVMELLRGEDLGRRLARTARLGVEETAAVVVQACRGLGRAHAVNIVHRDIKPDNLFLVADEDGLFIKLLDFGVAKTKGAGDATHQTDAGQIVGTPLYMSPEQVQGRLVDERCDLYSLATVAYRCLTGRPPFIEKHVGDLLVAISTRTPPPASTLEPALPRSVDTWFASMFSKDPNARCCQTVRDVADSFEVACRGVSLLTTLEVGTTALRLQGEAPTLPGEPDRPPTVATERGVVDATLSPALNPAQRESISTSGGRTWLLLALAGTALSVGALAVWTRDPAMARPEPMATERLPRQQPPPRHVMLRYSVTPSTARLYLDGQELPANPFAGSEPFDSRVHRLRAEAPGYLPVETSVALDHDIQIDLSLSPAPSASSAVAPSPDERRTVPAARPTSIETRAASRKLTPRARDTEPSEPKTDAPPESKLHKRPLELDRTSPWPSP